MKNIRKFLFTLIILFIIKNKYSALTYGGCDYSTISNLKSLINNINISYTYEIKENNAYFNVILNNIPGNIYFIDSVTQKRYEYSEANNGELIISGYKNIQNGQYNFYVNNNICNGIKLGTKYYSFPMYNIRHEDEICKDIPNFSLCKRWISRYYSDYEFEKKINEYKETIESNQKIKNIEYEKSILDIIIEFYIKYYYYFLPIIIIICIIIMYVNRKKNSFRL